MNLIRYTIIVAALAGTTLGADLFACPFCSVESQTLSEETKGADAVVLAKLLKEAPEPADANDPNSGMATFEVIEKLKGAESLGAAKEFKVVFYGDTDRTKTYLVTGIGKEKVEWTTPLPLTPAAVNYVRKLPTVAPAGAERLEFFQEFLENPDPLLAQDAYDEFGRAPYSDLHALKPKMKHDRIVKWVADPEVSPSRRRLYLTMLGVCGSKADVPLLEAMIVSDFDTMKTPLVGLVGTGMAMRGPVGLPIIIEAVQQDERRKKLGLDALVACYLILRGPDGMDLVEERFLKNPKAEYTHVYSTIMALRFHGDENTGVVPRERLLGAMRLLLSNADFADQVILDLSRWEDWSVLDRMVEMFKQSVEESKKTDASEKGYVRQPVVSYLTVASEQPGEVGTRGKTALAELEKLDPETVKTAKSLMAFGALGRARGAATSTTASGVVTDNKAEPDDRGAKQPAADATQGFAASPEDEKTDASQIPDPAAFGQSGQGSDNVGKRSAAKPGAVDTAKANDKASAVSQPSAATSLPTKSTHANPLLVAGLPLLAAALLMGIYWSILRSGAV
jgi:hypothetical protein